MNLPEIETKLETLIQKVRGNKTIVTRSTQGNEEAFDTDSDDEKADNDNLSKTTKLSRNKLSERLLTSISKKSQQHLSNY